MKRLTKIANICKTDKGTVVGEKHSFTEFYDHYFQKYLENDEINILEIGIYHGGSLKMFNEYFDHRAQIYAIDIDNSTLKDFGPNVHTYHCDQSSEKDINDFLEKIGNIKFDIILDDGSHKFSHQLTSLYALRNSLKEDGIYVLEDLHTSYNWGTVTDSPLYYLNFFNYPSYMNREKIDELNSKIKNVTINIKMNPFGDFAHKSVTSIIEFK